MTTRARHLPAAPALLVALSAAMLAVGYFCTVAPGHSYTKIWLNDVFGLTDGAYRVFRGQIPSVNFNGGGYGAALFVPGAIAMHLGFQPAVALAFGELLVSGFLLGAAVIALSRRFSIWPSVIFLIFVFLLVVAPVKMGGKPFEWTYGTFYNRNGWAGLAIVLLYFVEPRRDQESRALIDATALAMVLLFLALNKVNFFLVAAAFVAANAFVAPYNRRVSSIAACLTFASLVLLELSSGYISAYLTEIREIAEFNPRMLPSVKGVAWALYRAGPELAAAVAAAGLYVAIRRRSFVVLAFCAFVIVACVVLGTQSYADLFGLPALIAVPICLGELLDRDKTTGSCDPHPNAISGQAANAAIFTGVLVALGSPITMGVLELAAYREAATGAGPRPSVELSGFLVQAAVNSLDSDSIPGKPDHVLRAAARRQSKDDLTTGEYISLIDEGVALLRANANSQDLPVVTLDMVNPFGFLLDLKPTDYGRPLFWVGTNFTETKHPNAQSFFSDAVFVMQPMVPYQQRQLDAMLAIYGQYLHLNFQPIAASTNWRLWQRKHVVSAE